MSRYTLGVDTSNYATSLAVFDTAGEVVCAKKRFLPVKAGQLGLRQSDALFHHTAALPEMLQELVQEFDLTKIDAVGVSQKPRPVEGSYMPCFLAGVSAATAFAAARDIPLIYTTHQQGHAAAALYAAKGEALFSQKVLLFHISGGTTDLLLCDQVRTITTLGTSTDLYAGQAVDRVGVRLGFAPITQPAIASLLYDRRIQAEQLYKHQQRKLLRFLQEHRRSHKQAFSIFLY